MYFRGCACNLWGSGVVARYATADGIDSPWEGERRVLIGSPEAEGLANDIARVMIFGVFSGE